MTSILYYDSLIYFEFLVYFTAIASLQADLRGFLSAVGNWGMAKEIPETLALCEQIDRSFQITSSRARERY
ncbi:MAG: hypothetical protein SAJ11_03310 [Jaaginema sp. PMC 1078.18]|nr:hypothetical protein [Jaaginema sp. PMC 1078.18]